MTMQHSVFNEGNARLVGSPAVARLLISKSRRLSLADFCATRIDLLSAIHFARPAFVHHVPVDPAAHPADLCQSVRVFGFTERQLADLSAAMGFEFWGEAAALVLGYAAAFPGDFEVCHLRERAPAGLLKAKGTIKRGKVLVAPSVRGLQVPLTRATLDFLVGTAARQRLSVKDVASLIVNRHAPRVLALVSRPAQ